MNPEPRVDRIIATAFWRRLDSEGHDTCRLYQIADGWRLTGCAIFDLEGNPCLLNYTVDTDARWRTISAGVSGAIGFEELRLEIEAVPGRGWLLNGVAQNFAGSPLDLDLGFTPATNLLAIRRLDPPLGSDTLAPAAYLAFPDLELRLLEQTYRKTGNTTFAYAAPVYDYKAELTVSPSGFVIDYPGLWSGAVSANPG
jgi:hypothetical protein